MPASRNYTISGNMKLGFPQNRVIKVNFPEELVGHPPGDQLKKGETVNVIGVSSCRGHLIIEHKSQNFHIPYQYTDLIRSNLTGGNNNNTLLSGNNTAVTATKGNNSHGNNSNNNNSNKNCNLTANRASVGTNPATGNGNAVKI